LQEAGLLVQPLAALPFALLDHLALLMLLLVALPEARLLQDPLLQLLQPFPFVNLNFRYKLELKNRNVDSGFKSLKNH
jgi:hypothetical protein